MRDIKEFKELYMTFDKTLNLLLTDAPLGSLPLANTLIDVILNKTLCIEKDLSKELINTMESGIITSIICRWYAMDPDDLTRSIDSKESKEIVNKCKLFVAKMREDYDHGEA